MTNNKNYWKNRIRREGFFVNFDSSYTPEVFNEQLLWRKVLDRALLDITLVGTSACEESVRWVEVSNEDFNSVCELANLPRFIVRKSFLKLKPELQRK